MKTGVWFKAEFPDNCKGEINLVQVEEISITDARGAFVIAQIPVPGLMLALYIPQRVNSITSMSMSRRVRRE